MTDVHKLQLPFSCFLKPTNECKAERATPLPQPLEEAPLLRFGTQWPPCLVWLFVLRQFASFGFQTPLVKSYTSIFFPLSAFTLSGSLLACLMSSHTQDGGRRRRVAARLPRRGDVSALRVGRWREKGKFGPCLGFGWRAGRRGRAG